MNYVKYLQQAGVPATLIPAAVSYFERAKVIAAKVTPYKWKAPFVVAWLVQKLPWEAEALPEKWKNYDNEVSINGDLAPWVWDDKLGKGVRQPCPLDDSGIQYCYYLEGYHPRSKLARWIWLGTRNLCSKLAYDLGVPISEEQHGRLRSWGDSETSKSHPGVIVYELDGHWQLYVVSSFGPFVIRRNVGVKLTNAVFSKQDRAAIVHISWSILRKTKEPK